jgi:hypothetical protein
VKTLIVSLIVSLIETAVWLWSGGCWAGKSSGPLMLKWPAFC